MKLRNNEWNTFIGAVGCLLIPMRIVIVFGWLILYLKSKTKRGEQEELQQIVDLERGIGTFSDKIKSRASSAYIAMHVAFFVCWFEGLQWRLKRY